ncbi:MAG: HEAT repeat domain-containing protein [Gemmataceae bacterium]
MTLPLVAGDDPLDADAAILRSAQLPTDGVALIDFVRRFAPTDEVRLRLEAAARSLGDPQFRNRQKATAELVAAGPAALAMLRTATTSKDAEVRQRAADCIRQIEQTVPLHARTAAARRLGAVRMPGATTALLAWLPSASDREVEAIREALTGLAKGSSSPELRATLNDSEEARRAAAAYALASSGAEDAVKLVKPLLTDSDVSVRLWASLGLAYAKEPAAVPVMIEVLGDLPPDVVWPAEAALVRLAGDEAPAVSLGQDAASRAACRAAWRGWWTKTGGRCDLGRLSEADLWRGLTLVAQTTPRGSSVVVEVGSDGTPRRTIDGLVLPVCVEWLPRDRVLIAEYNLAGRITERDFSGRIYWEKPASYAMACQRLANGRTFVASRAGLCEYDADGKQVWEVKRDRIATAARRRDGTTVVVSLADVVNANRESRCAILDASGKEIQSFSVGGCLTYAGIHLLPGGHILVPEYYTNRVAEYDANGKMVWSVPVQTPRSAQRLPNGHTLVVTALGQRGVTEFDRAGRSVGEYRPAESGNVLTARRR